MTVYSFGQITPHSLRSERLQKEIIEGTLNYDSLVIFDRSSFWADDKSVKGFVFKKGKCFKVAMIFQKTNEFAIELKRVEIENEKVFDVLNKYIDEKYALLKNLNNDSLNVKSRSNSFMTMSDQDEFSILIVFPKNNLCIYKSSYNPEAYQKAAWTADRQTLIDTFARLKAHIN